MAVINFLKYKIYEYKNKKSWRKRNENNETRLMSMCNQELLKVGNYTYGDLNISCSNNYNKLSIGSYCSIAGDVIFLLSSEHLVNGISTFPFKAKVLKYGKEGISKGDIIIDDDVWIGYGATIMSGVHIGQGAVIAAGAVVTKDVPPYAIVGGIPAKIIKYRFSLDIINELLKVDYSKLTNYMVKEHIDDLYSELIDVKQLEWLPKK